MSDVKVFIVVFSLFIVFMLGLTAVLTAGEYAGDKERTKQMEACVAAGKTWVRDGITNYYECK